MKNLDNSSCLDYLIDKVVELDEQLVRDALEKDILTNSLEFYQSLLLMPFISMGADSWN